MVIVKSDSGLRIGPWLERGIYFQEKRGVTRGYFFTNGKGEIMSFKGLGGEYIG